MTSRSHFSCRASPARKPVRKAIIRYVSRYGLRDFAAVSRMRGSSAHADDFPYFTALVERLELGPPLRPLRAERSRQNGSFHVDGSRARFFGQTLRAIPLNADIRERGRDLRSKQPAQVSATLFNERQRFLAWSTA